MKRLLLFAVAVLTVIASCKQEPQLSFKENLGIAANGGTATVEISANYEWKAQSQSSWIIVKSMSEGILTLSVDANNGYDSRTGNVTISSEGIVKTLVVTQDQKDVIIVKDGSEVRVKSEAHDITLSVQGNIAYQCSVIEGAQWLQVKEVKALVSSSVVLHASENPMVSERTATVLLKNTEKNYQVNVSIIQAGIPQVLKVTHSRETFTVPTLFGFNMSADINWGDGDTQTYKSNATHKYLSKKSYCVTVSGNNISTLSLSDVIGVDAIDLSGL